MIDSPTPEKGSNPNAPHCWAASSKSPGCKSDEYKRRITELGQQASLHSDQCAQFEAKIVELEGQLKEAFEEAANWASFARSQRDASPPDNRLVLEEPAAPTTPAPDLIHRICHAASGQCMAFDHPECSPCTPENCEAFKAAFETEGSKP